MKCITLWQPWATWIALGWKTIETRTHPRFVGLVGKHIAIHAGLRWDKDAVRLASIWLADWQVLQTRSFRDIHGVVVCTAHVDRHTRLSGDCSRAAKIDCCHTKRYGLFFSDIQKLPEAMPAKGHQGIWNVDLSPNPKEGEGWGR